MDVRLRADSRSLLCALVFVSTALAPADGGAAEHCVYNHTTEMVYANGAAIADRDSSASYRRYCAASFRPVSFEITVRDNYRFACRLTIPADGEVHVKVWDRAELRFEPALPPQYYCEAKDGDGGLIAQHPPGVADQNRYIRFLAISDPQYRYNAGLDQQEALIASARTNVLFEVIGARTLFSRTVPNHGPGIRGILIAGDLTQYTGAKQFADLLAALTPRRNWYFEGLGNHDFGTTAPLHFVSNAYREANLAAQSGPHYSWDWHDTHFVQLNVAAIDAVKGAEGKDVVPFAARTFLAADLAKNVGDSGRPVVIIQHYGLDKFSYEDNWWTGGQIAALVDVLFSYNVAAFITGHLHIGPSGTVKSGFDVDHDGHKVKQTARTAATFCRRKVGSKWQYCHHSKPPEVEAGCRCTTYLDFVATTARPESFDPTGCGSGKVGATGASYSDVTIEGDEIRVTRHAQDKCQPERFVARSEINLWSIAPPKLDWMFQSSNRVKVSARLKRTDPNTTHLVGNTSRRARTEWSTTCGNPTAPTKRLGTAAIFRVEIDGTNRNACLVTGRYWGYNGRSTETTWKVPPAP